MKNDNYIMTLIVIIIILLASISVKGEPNSDVRVYDISDLFMDSKPIISYDMLFGDIIKASSFFVADRKHPCFNYSYTYDKNNRLIIKKISHIFSGIESVREYKYYDNGLVSEITEKRENFLKRISFYYKDTKIFEVDESIEPVDDEVILQKYDRLKYKFDGKGNITEVRGIKSKMLGLSSESIRLKIYDYDEMNRLKAIRDFSNPEETQIFSYDDYVKR